MININWFYLTDKIECLLPNSLLGSRISPSRNMSSLFIWVSKRGCSAWSIVVCWEQPGRVKRSLTDLFWSLLQPGEEGKLFEEVWGWGWKLQEDSFLLNSLFLCCLALKKFKKMFKIGGIGLQNFSHLVAFRSLSL